MRTGLYNGLGHDVTVWYWNTLVNTYGPYKGQVDNIESYTLENYLRSINEMLVDMTRHNPGAKAWIQLPWVQVYEPFQNLVFWWESIIGRFELDSRVEAFYYADEPEIWGSEWGPDMGGVRPSDVSALLPLIQAKTSKPLVAVHCDLPLYDANMAGFKPRRQGFDLYPFMHGRATSVQEFRSSFAHWASRFCTTDRFFVMQGCGSRDPAGRENYGQRDFTFEEAKPYLDVIRDMEPNVVLFWSADRCDPDMALVVKQMAEYLKRGKVSRGFLYWLRRLIGTIFKR